MEYGSLNFAYIGIIGLIFWAIDYFHLFKKAEIFTPKGSLERKTYFWRFLFFIVGATAWGFISYSLTTPKLPVGRVDDKLEANDIIFVVDVSKSMLADDFKPNRLEVAKNKILDFVKLRPRDRIGVITFSEKAFTLLPLTTDLSLITRIIGEIETGFLGSGTNIGDALGLAVGRSIKSVAKNKTIILLTDGVSNVGIMTPEQAATNAKNAKVKVYTIGIGGNKGARIPVGRDKSGTKQYRPIPGGGVDKDVLASIANITGGKNYDARSAQALNKILLDIEKMERTEIDVSGHIVYKELYHKYLLIGLILFIFVEVSRRLFLRESI